MEKFYIQLLVWAAVIGGLFAFLWKQGYLVRLSAYVTETREELKKCSWPSKGELWQSTVMVAVVIFGLGLFTVVVDFIILKLVRSFL